jgi:hypothetical protein
VISNKIATFSTPPTCGTLVEPVENFMIYKKVPQARSFFHRFTTGFSTGKNRY